jgi:hypothetical protein
VYRPTTLQEVRDVTEQFMHHYNEQRSHQGRSCKDQPPQVAFPTLPKLPPVPETIDPDGCVDVDLEPYYIKRALVGQQIVLLVNALDSLFEVYQDTTLIKQVPIKGLHGDILPFDRYVTPH